MTCPTLALRRPELTPMFAFPPASEVDHPYVPGLYPLIMGGLALFYPLAQAQPPTQAGVAGILFGLAAIGGCFVQWYNIRGDRKADRDKLLAAIQDRNYWQKQYLDCQEREQSYREKDEIRHELVIEMGRRLQRLERKSGGGGS
jgi:hypothetical protein